jgi:hypothetical protein
MAKKNRGRGRYRNRDRKELEWSLAVPGLPGNPVSGLEKPSAGFLWPDTIRVLPTRKLETIEYSIEDTYQGLYQELRGYLGKGGAGIPACDVKKRSQTRMSVPPSPEIEVVFSGDKSKERLVGRFAPKANSEYRFAKGELELMTVVATDVP